MNYLREKCQSFHASRHLAVNSLFETMTWKILGRLMLEVMKASRLDAKACLQSLNQDNQIGERKDPCGI